MHPTLEFANRSQLGVQVPTTNHQAAPPISRAQKKEGTKMAVAAADTLSDHRHRRRRRHRQKAAVIDLRSRTEVMLTRKTTAGMQKIPWAVECFCPSIREISLLPSSNFHLILPRTAKVMRAWRTALPSDVLNQIAVRPPPLLLTTKRHARPPPL